MASEQEYRRWTTAELKALPDTAVMEDDDGRRWSPYIGIGPRRHPSTWMEYTSGTPFDTEHAHRLARRKLRRMR